MTSRTISCPDVSVVLAVRNAEETVGRDVRRIAERMRSLGVSFEIIATNDGCFDTSFAVLRLLATQLPELRLFPANVSGRAFARAMVEARGDAVALFELTTSSVSLAPLGWALARVAARRDAVVLRGRCIVARRLRCVSTLALLRGRGPGFERAFERAAPPSLDIEIRGTSPGPTTGIVETLGWLRGGLRLGVLGAGSRSR